MHTAVLDVVAPRLPDDGLILAPQRTARDLPVATDRLRDDDLAALRPAAYAAAVLIDDQLSRAGEHAEELVDALGAALRPAGVLAATMCNGVYAAAAAEPCHGRGYSAAQVRSLLNHRGFTVEVLCAPGAAARLRGALAFDLDADRQPGLLDAAPRLLVIARAPRSAHERTQVFHSSRPHKITAAATICRDPDGRLLVVYDRFRRVWTIPGGVIDADEDPAAAARRETWEEGGVKVDIGRMLGVFAQSWPDRLTFVFAAHPTTMVEHPEPIHHHEIAQVAWLPLDAALERLAPDVVLKVRRCLDQPGFSWGWTRVGPQGAEPVTWTAEA